MTQPVWIDCRSVADVASPQQLAAMASGGHHIVLRFHSLRPDEKAGLIDHLSAALPEFSVFDSGGGLSPACVTVMPVVATDRVRKRRSEILQAVFDYRRACAALVTQYRGGALPREWRTQEHGGHCRFTNLCTGQVVEAPFAEWAEPDRVDPFFFAEFVKTTAGCEAVAEMIQHNFHDGARILELVAAKAEPSVAHGAAGRADSEINERTRQVPRPSMPALAVEALTHAESFELLSLNPNGANDNSTAADRFHGWRVLGKTPIEDDNTRRSLISALETGVAESDQAAICFEPRHAIRVQHSAKAINFVICFECYQIEWYIDGTEQRTFMTSRSPQRVFDETLRSASVPLAPPGSKRNADEHSDAHAQESSAQSVLKSESTPRSP